MENQRPAAKNLLSLLTSRHNVRLALGLFSLGAVVLALAARPLGDYQTLLTFLGSERATAFWLGVFGATALAALIWIPRLQTRHLDSDPAERTRLTFDARRTLAQILAGGLLLLGAYATTRQLALSADLNFTSRISAAIEQLGSDDPTVRTAGVYSLERIASDSPEDALSIYRVLLSHLRSAREPKTAGGTRLLADQQAALRALASDAMALRRDEFRLILDGLDLTAADLQAANLRGASLRGTILRDAQMRRAILDDADLSDPSIPPFLYSGSHRNGADLTGANLREASLARIDGRGAKFDSVLADSWYSEPAVFRQARLIEASFVRASLMGADFRDATLDQGSFTEASLAEADLRQAHVFSTDFSGALLMGARLDGIHLFGDVLMRDATLRGVDFSGVDLRWVFWEGADLRAADLSKSTGFQQRHLRTSCMDESTLLPAGFGPPATCEAEITNVPLYAGPREILRKRRKRGRSEE